MPPEMASLVIFGVQELIRQTPAIADDIRALLDKNDPNDQDWDNLRVKVMAKKYRDYVPASDLPPDAPSGAAA